MRHSPTRSPRRRAVVAVPATSALTLNSCAGTASPQDLSDVQSESDHVDKAKRDLGLIKGRS